MARNNIASLIAVQEPFFEAIIRKIAPVKAAQRYRARLGMLMAESYAGASKSRRGVSGWVTASGDADSDINNELPILRERSRDLHRNNALALASTNVKVSNIVGSGIKLQARLDRNILGLADSRASELESLIEAEFNAWASSPDIDIERTLNFYAFQELALRSVLESGDCFILTPSHKISTSPYSLRLQLVEADRCCNSDNVMDTQKLSGGIEKDKNGAPLFYHFAKHPGSRYSTVQTWQRIRAFGRVSNRRNVIHLFRKIRIGQTRGVPDLAPVMEAIKQLGRYTDAEVMKAVVQSFLTVFVKTADPDGLALMEPTSEIGGSASDKDFKMGHGNIVDLRPEEDIEMANSTSPNNNFDPFVISMTRQISAALELPYESLLKHFVASYSASRAALLEAWRFFLGRRNWLASSLCRPIYELWFMEAVLLGRLEAPGFFSGDPLIRSAWLGADWIGPPKGMIDPIKENIADRIAEDRGWKTAAQNAMERGNDWDKTLPQRRKEIAQKIEAGLDDEAKVSQTGRGVRK